MAVYSAYTDQELTALLKQGDQLAFTEIYERYKGPLYVHAFDLLREFSMLWIGRDEMEIHSHLSGYLYTAVRNRIFKFITHKQALIQNLR